MPLAAWVSPQLYGTKRAGPRSRCECAEGARSVRSGAAIFPQRFTRYEDAQSCSSPRAHARSAHITSLLFFGRSGRRRRTPLLAGSRRGLLFRPAPHTMLRIVFVAVDRAHIARSVTHSRDARGARTRRFASRYRRTPLRRSFGPLRPRPASRFAPPALERGGQSVAIGRGKVSGWGMRAGTRRPSPCRVSIGRVQEDRGSSTEQAHGEHGGGREEGEPDTGPRTAGPSREPSGWANFAKKDNPGRR